MSTLKDVFIREFSYLTNQVRWRKWIVSFYVISMMISLTTSILFRENEIIFPHVVIGVMISIVIIQFFLTFIHFKNPLFKDVPESLGYTLMLNLIHSLWNRVMIFSVLMISSLYITMYTEFNIFQYIFYFTLMCTLFFDLTLKESINVFIQIRIMTEYEDD